MRFFDVLTKKEFNNGNEQVRLWHKVGVIKITESNKWYLQLFHQPDTDFYVVEHEGKKEALPTIHIDEEDGV